MNQHDDPFLHDEHGEHDEHDPLRARLRALPRQMAPPAAGWTQLRDALPARTADTPAPPARASGTRLTTRRRRLRWALPAGAALAASIALYWVAPMSTPMHAPGTAAVAPSVLQQQARLMTTEYQQAMAALPEVDAPEWRPALVELDDSAHQIRDALAQSPRSRHLLDQLQRTYALRLELTRQAALSAAGLPT